MLSTGALAIPFKAKKKLINTGACKEKKSM
jgi:hypothetical protein